MPPGTEVYRAIAEAVSAGRPAALAVVVRTRGSTPREAGAKMVLLGDGRSAGTIGGGCGEAEVLREALDVLQGAGSRLVTVDLTATAEESGMLCGGVMEVFVEQASPPHGAEDMEIWGLAWDCMQRGEPFCTATAVDVRPEQAAARGTMMLVSRGGDTAHSASIPQLDEKIWELASEVLASGRSRVATMSVGVGETSAEAEVFFDVVAAPPTLLVLGGGHIALPLAKMGSMLGFEVIVVDDRPSFANESRFPEAKQVICDDFANALPAFMDLPGAYAVIVTRGHSHDEECLRALAGADLAYLGMIGSKRKVKEMFRRLEEDGVPRTMLDQVHAPIGLAIGAETPEEIALSIMAEIVMARRASDRKPPVPGDRSQGAER